MSRFVGDISAGLESQIYEEFVRLSAFQKLIVVTEQSNLTTQKNIKVIKIHKISIPKIRGLYKISGYLFATFVHRNMYDKIYLRTFSLPELISSLFATVCLHKPLIVLVPGSWIFVGNNFKTKLARYIFKKLLNKSQITIFYSKLIVGELSSLLGNFDQSKIKIIKNAVDVDVFLPADRQTDNSIIYVGRIHPLKQIDDIIYSLKHLKNNHQVLFKIVGIIESKSYYLHLKKICKDLGLEKNVVFLGPKPHNEIQKLLNRSKVFVFMGKYEGIPRSLLEAMSCGKPVIAAPNSGIPDVIEDGKNGFLVNNSDPQNLAKCIQRILSDDALQCRLGCMARKTIEKNHTWQEFIASLDKILRQA